MQQASSCLTDVGWYDSVTHDQITIFSFTHECSTPQLRFPPCLRRVPHDKVSHPFLATTCAETPLRPTYLCTICSSGQRWTTERPHSDLETALPSNLRPQNDAHTVIAGRKRVTVGGPELAMTGKKIRSIEWAGYTSESSTSAS